MNKLFLNHNVVRILGLSILLLIILLQLTATRADAQVLGCSAPYLIDETFPNGARWEMCWEERAREGIVYYDVYYTTATGIRRKVLGQANLAQIHVVYDNNAGRYHDITSYTLSGLDVSHLALAAGECPNGSLIANSDARNVICQQIELDHDYAYRAYSPKDYKLASHMKLTNVFRIQRYFYVSSWEFHDDGSISPEVGASGALQIYGSAAAASNDLLYGWPIGSLLNPNQMGISHVHSYWWRLDFDLDGSMDDVVEEIEFLPASADRKREMSITRFVTETARTVSAETFRLWRVLDTNSLNGDAHNISYEIQPNGSGIFRGPTYEPWTQHDIYFTVSKSCEIFATENNYANTDGCGADMSTFVDNEAIDGSNDLVVWYGAAFHHLPRDEDDFPMPIHSEGFHIIPRDWSGSNPIEASSEIPLAIAESQSAETAQNALPLQQSVVIGLSLFFVVGVVLIRKGLKE